MVPFQKKVKYLQQKWYHFRKGSKIANENSTILVRKGSNSSTKMVKIHQQTWYHFRRGSNIFNKNGTISGKGQKSSTKIVPFSQKKVKFLNKNGKNPSTNMVPFQKRVKHRQQKMVLFQKKDKMVNENGTILVRKGSKFLNKNGTISENGQKSSTKMVPFL